MSIYLKVEIGAGTDIQAAARETIALANKVGLTVEFMFNGVPCLARAGDDPRSLADAWHDIVLKRTTTPIAVGRQHVDRAA